MDYNVHPQCLHIVRAQGEVKWILHRFTLKRDQHLHICAANLQKLPHGGLHLASAHRVSTRHMSTFFLHQRRMEAQELKLWLQLPVCAGPRLPWTAFGPGLHSQTPPPLLPQLMLVSALGGGELEGWEMLKAHGIGPRSFPAPAEREDHITE